MSPSIGRFLTIGTGPSRLRAEFRLQAWKTIRLSKELVSLRELHTSIPRTLFGAELLELMGSRLNGVISFAAEAGKEPESGQSRLWVSVLGSSDSMPASNFKLGVKSLSIGQPTDTAALANDGPETLERQWLRGRESISEPYPIEVVRNTRSEMDPHELKILPGNVITAGSSQKRVPPSQSVSGHYTRSVNEPLLLKKLNEYWQLIQRDTDREGEVSPPRQQANSGSRKVAAPSTSNQQTTLTGSEWPEYVGRQSSEMIRRSLDSGGSEVAQCVERIVDTHHPDKVEIHNIFNVDLTTKSGAGHPWGEDLADSIAEVLREQALRHGIDIT